MLVLFSFISILLINNKEIHEKDFNKDQIDFFKKMPIFSSMSPYAISILIGLCELKEYPIGKIIYKEGDKCQRGYFIKEGQIKVFRFF